MLKGFLSGVALTILIALGVLFAFQFASAHGDSEPDTIQSGLSRGVGLFGADTTSGDDSSVSTASAENDSESTTNDDSETSSNSSDSLSYVALGDSVAAGLGLPYIDSATAQDERCGRSSEAYAYEVGRQLNYENVQLYACSGASSGDLYTRQWISNSNPNIQINQAFSQGQPDVISITVGANDINWSRLVQRCYAGNCGTAAQTRAVDSDLDDVRDYLTSALLRINNRSTDTPPTVIITGYYNPISAECAAAIPGGRVTAAEIGWITEGVDKLNQTLEAVAEDNDSFVRFAAVDFSGHDICSDDPWVQGLDDEAPIHPTAEGQRVIAESVVEAIER